MINKKIILLLLINLNALAMYGQNVSITWTNFNTASPGLRTIGQLKTSPSKDIASSNWSVGCETLDRDYADFDQYKQYVGELGVKHGRLQSGWAKCERVKGKYEFEWLDKHVDGLIERNVNPWMVLCYGNPLYKSGEKLGARIFTDEETMNLWLKYVRATVKRYKNRVKEWEVWNEPNLGDNVNFAAPYANLLMNTVKVIKEEQPDAVIIGFALAGTPLHFAKEVFEALKAKGQEKIVDYLSFHPYVHNPDEANADIDALRALAKSYDPDIRLYQGENGCPSILEWGHALNGYPWTEISQAKWELRRMANDWNREIRSSIFTIVDLKYPNMLQSFGLIRTNLLHEVIYKRPSYYAVKHMVNLLQADVLPAGKIAHNASGLREVTVLGLKKDKIYGALLWFSDQVPSDLISWQATDLLLKNTALKNPVYLDLITGKVYEIPKYQVKQMGPDQKFRGLPVWDSPMLIVERDKLNFTAFKLDKEGNTETAGIM